MALTWHSAKDPDEVKDYTVDWTNLLGGDTIATSTWTLVDGAGLTINSNTNTATKTTVWLSLGTLGENYALRNRVTTAAGRTFDQTCRLKCRAK